MGKYYSAASNSDAFADSSGFGLANIDSIGFAFWFAGGITCSDIRFPDLKPDARRVNTARVLEVRPL